MASKTLITLHIDGMEIEAHGGATILQAADAVGIYIPRLCSHPDLPSVLPENLKPWDVVYQGSARFYQSHDGGGTDEGEGGFDGCRLCLVRIDGERPPVRACVTEAQEGMRVTTSDHEIDSRRKERLRAIFSNHPHACVQCAQREGCALEPCSTNVAKEERCCPIFHVCELRKVAEFIGIPNDTPRYRPADRSVVVDEPLFLRDHNLCIGCLRCVRMCRDVRKVDALGFVLQEDGRPTMGTKAPTLGDSGCRFCLSCVEVCPTGALRLKIDDPRSNGARATRCVSGCPAGMDVPRYLREVRRGEFARAEAVIRETAPLPRVLGEVCFHPCEEGCFRDALSDAVAVCSLKRAAMEHSDSNLWEAHLAPRPPTGKSVAVVGAGPAGLTASWFLKLLGHDVVLLDSQFSPGGWLRDGIPRFRLSRGTLDRDITDIKSIGIDFKMGVEVGKDVSLEELRADHDAVLIAVGARAAKKLPCEGTDLAGVESGLELLKRLASGKGSGRRPFENETVVLIGGGNVALDVARTALRLGSRDVHLFCLESREEMPAHGWEIEDAEREGVVVHPSWGPTLISGPGRVQSVDFQRCVSVFDDEGRFRPVFDEATTTTHRADRVLVAIGQEPNLSVLSGQPENRHEPPGALQVDSSLQTSAPGLFGAGEIVSGPASVIDAIAQGRRAASSIDRFLGGEGDLDFSLLDETELDGELEPVPGFPDLPRIPAPRRTVPDPVRCFTPVEGTYSREQAIRESERCLRCDLRLAIRESVLPPEPWIALTSENVASLPETAGVYQLLDETKTVYAIKGVDCLRAALAGALEASSKAKFFLYDEDPMFSKRESELIQEYLKKHGRMPSGEGEDDLDDLF